MVLMAGLVKLPTGWLATLGLVVVAGHNLLDPYTDRIVGAAAEGRMGWLWKLLYVAFFAGPIQAGPDGPSLIVLYTIVPWIGVMALGHAFGRILVMEPARRDRLCLAIGLGAVALFLVLRGLDLYGDPRPWRQAIVPRPDGRAAMPPLLAFLDASKYPASLLFLLMTLGPAIAAMPALERARGAIARWLAVFGRVPFFFYLFHIPVIHTMALVVSKVRLGEVSPWLFTDHPMGSPPPPEGYAWGLGTLYLVWALAVALLWMPCRWFASSKSSRTDWWLRYL
jgi:uncharacterized membrane protein